MEISLRQTGLPLRHFEPEHIFECGQCFRWNREEDGSYTGVAYGRILNVKKSGDTVFFSWSGGEDDFQSLWRRYFDLERDYGEIRSRLAALDSVMERAVAYGNGLRILNQEPWEVLVSFILSANNGVKRIQKTVEALSEAHGKEIGVYRGRKRYAFPEPEALAGLSPEAIRACGAGYRDIHVLKAARAVAENAGWLRRVCRLDTEEARRKLIALGGVGPKVSDCILLFSMEKLDTFPVDVWVRRIMEAYYLPPKSSPEAIARFADRHFGELKGIAQQYLFYYARSHGIGK